MCSKNVDILKKRYKKGYRILLIRYSMVMMMSVFIMKPVMIWDIWRIPAIMM